MCKPICLKHQQLDWYCKAYTKSLCLHHGAPVPSLISVHTQQQRISKHRHVSLSDHHLSHIVQEHLLSSNSNIMSAYPLPALLIINALALYLRSPLQCNCHHESTQEYLFNRFY